VRTGISKIKGGSKGQAGSACMGKGVGEREQTIKKNFLQKRDKHQGSKADRGLVSTVKGSLESRR